MEIGRRRERCLLGLLLIDLGRPLRAERLIGLLWDGEPPATARAHLQTHVSRLRRRLRAAGQAAAGFAITGRGETYTLTGDPEVVDLHRLRGRLAAARAAADPRASAELLAEALAEWRGSPLDDVASEPLRSRLAADADEVLLSAMTLRVESLLAAGRGDLPLDELSELSRRHPGHERLTALRMLCLHRAGRRAEALRVFGEARARLAEELGLDPGPELRHAHSVVLGAGARRKPAGSRAGAGPAGGPVPSSPVPSPPVAGTACGPWAAGWAASATCRSASAARTA